MRVVVLTCSRTGTASRILPALCACPEIVVVKVVLAHGGSPNVWKRRWRRVQKVLRIGLLGAINGVRMRAWYRDCGTAELEDLCRQLGVSFVETPFINCDHTISIFRESDADLGLSLGNGYISDRVFSIPRYGMINLHEEILPDFQGASSIIWPIYENLSETGFTIHQVNRKIDGGDILYQERRPLVFGESLRATVETNLAIGRARTPAAMVKVCSEYETLRNHGVKQTQGRSYTTPSIWQYLRMRRNHSRLRRASSIA